MKKTNSVLQILACIVLMGIVCSCCNSRNSKVDEQSMTDSVDEIAKDSTDKAEEAYNRTHSSDAILKRVKSMFGNDDFFSEEYKKADKELQDYADKYCPGDIVGPDYIVWDTSQGGCGEGKTEFADVRDITENSATIKVFNKFDCDDDHNIVLHLIFEKGNWYVDDISNCFSKSIKNDIKKELEDIKKVVSSSSGGSNSKYFGKWTYYINTQGRRMRCYSVVIYKDMTCDFITYTPNGDKNVLNLRKCVFSNGFAYLTDNGDITLKGTPRFKLGSTGLLTVDGDEMVKE